MDSVRKWGRKFSLISLVLLLVAAAGCSEKVDLAEEKRKRYQVDGSSLGANLTPDSSEDAVLETNTGIAIETDIDALMSRSKMLEMRSQQISFQEMLNDLEIQQNISERLLQLELNEEQRLFAVQNLLLSLLKRIATTDLKAREQIIKILPEYLDDKNDTIQQLAWGASATIHLTDYLRVEDADSSDLDATIDQMLSRFGDNPVVARELQGLVVQLMIRERRDKAVEIMDKLSQAYANSSNPKLQNMSEVIRDRMYLTQIQFDVVAEKMRTGEEGYKEQFLEMVLQLAQRKDMGKEIYREILATERWLEEIDQYQDAERMLAILEKNLANHPDETFRQIVAEDITKARSRIQLVGQPLVLKGQNRAGKSLSTEDQQGKVTLVVFWSATEPNSVRFLQQMLQIYGRYQGRDLEIVSYCIDKNIAQALSVLGNQSPPWVSMYRKEDVADEQGPDRAGVQQLPFLILLDREGKVIDVNVSIRKLPDELEKALRQ
ncbi:MAG: TlpA family protein disulfide reductase [Mariniblastus sp.]|nr:TlpA family protein disulfide reductase [Mariniblastus sp.]